MPVWGRIEEDVDGRDGAKEGRARKVGLLMYEHGEDEVNHRHTHAHSGLQLSCIALSAALFLEEERKKMSTGQVHIRAAPLA